MVSDEAERQSRLLRWCNLPAYTEHKVLSTFNTYGDKKLAEALSLAHQVADADDTVIFLTLIGESDTGKSHLGIGICREWLAKDKAAVYVNTSRLLNELRDGFDREGKASFYSRLKFYCRVGLLVLDDFGTEKITEWGAEQLQTIINSRYDDALHTVVTSNRTIDDLFNATDIRKNKDREETWRELANMRVQSRLQRESWCRVLVLNSKPHIER
jgi:DNA replication protein DnaC